MTKIYEIVQLQKQGCHPVFWFFFKPGFLNEWIFGRIFWPDFS